MGSLRLNVLCRSWSTHGEGYLNKCKAGDIEPNPRAMHQADDGDDDGAGQMKIDGFVQRTPKSTRDGLKEYIMNWLIATDQVCRSMLYVCMINRLTPY